MKADPGPKPEVLSGRDYTSRVDHHLITTSQDFECHSLGGVDTPDSGTGRPACAKRVAPVGPEARGRVGDPPDLGG